MLTHYVNDIDHNNPTVILLHGFISDHTTFHLIIDNIYKQNINVITIDLPGHGKDHSTHDVTWDMAYISKEIVEIIDYYKLSNVYLHGYSMGGRVALSVAVEYPNKLNGLILESASPGISNLNEKLNRIELDNIRAEKIKSIGIEAFVDEWSKMPLFDSQLSLSDVEKNRIKQMRLSQSPEGLAKSLTDYGTGNQPSNWKALHQLNIPTCILVGEYDEKFINIGQKMKQYINNSEFHIVNRAGHTIHVEQPEKFDTIIIDFILGGKLCQDNGKL